MNTNKTANAFDKVIGYNDIKNELLQMCDMICHNEYYGNLGVKIPKGVLLYGEPGTGKTLVSECFIEQTGIPAYTLRRKGSGDDFSDIITETFRKASENTPSIVFLDDLDKFANSDVHHSDAPEFITVQTCMDEFCDKELTVIATANDIEKLPRSLIRPGRFDRKFEMCCPNAEDSREIVKYYLRGRNIAPDADMCDIAMMIRYSTCAELETILNEAAISAAYDHRGSIERRDFIRAVLKIQYKSLDDRRELDDNELLETAVHEAGHLVISELLCPGSIGMVSVQLGDDNTVGGFVHRCVDTKDTKETVMISLAGKAASEIYHPGTVAKGCRSDMKRASRLMFARISDEASHGFGFADPTSDFTSTAYNARLEAVIQAELERYILEVKKLLCDNMEFLQRSVEALRSEGTLLYSDIARLRNNSRAEV